MIMTEQERIESIKRNGGNHLKNFKPENITYDMCLAAVKEDGNAITYVPDSFRTKEVYTEACGSSGLVLGITPPKYYSDELYKLAVHSNGMALEYVPENSRTTEICRLAVLNTPKAFKYVPAKLVTAELCLDSLRAQARSVWNHKQSKSVMTSGYESFEMIPAAVRTSDLCLELVKLEPELLWKFPRKNRTVAVSKAAINAMGYTSVEDAIKNDPRLLIKMHASLCTEKASMMFLDSYLDGTLMPIIDERGVEHRCTIIDDGNILDEGAGRFFFVGIHDMPLKNILKWKSVTEKAIEAEPLWLKDVPDKIIDQDLCFMAVKEDPYALRYVPDRYKNKELCMIAYEQSIYELNYIPVEFITPEMCKDVIDRGADLGYIPAPLRTKDLCIYALSKKRMNIYNVPEELIDEEIILVAVKEGVSLDFKKFKGHLTYKTCLEAVKASPYQIKYVPEELMSDELRVLANK